MRYVTISAPDVIINFLGARKFLFAYRTHPTFNALIPFAILPLAFGDRGVVDVGVCRPLGLGGPAAVAGAATAIVAAGAGRGSAACAAPA